MRIQHVGVTFSCDLRWDRHFAAVVKISSRRLYALRVLSPIMCKEDLKVVYQSIIRSLMEYCSPLFGNVSVRNHQLLEKLQKKSHRIVCHQECKWCTVFLKICVHEGNICCPQTF